MLFTKDLKRSGCLKSKGHLHPARPFPWHTPAQSKTTQFGSCSNQS